MKKVFSFILVVVLSIGCLITTYASTNDVSPYENILNSINKEYNLELGYVEVDENKVSVKEYTRITRKIAKQQRELLDYIAEREKEVQTSKLSDEMGIINATTVTKTRTKDVWGFEAYFKIKATYDVTGIRISSMRNASLDYKLWAHLTDTYITDLSSPTYGIIDSGRTGTVKYIGDLHYGPFTTYENVSFYTEFYYSE